jgi:hypothetical protein
MVKGETRQQTLLGSDEKSAARDGGGGEKSFSCRKKEVRQSLSPTVCPHLGCFNHIGPIYRPHHLGIVFALEQLQEPL